MVLWVLLTQYIHITQKMTLLKGKVLKTGANQFSFQPVLNFELPLMKKPDWTNVAVVQEIIWQIC